MRHKELVELLTPEVLLVLVVLVDGIRVGNRVILVGQELFESQHWWLSLQVTVILGIRAGRSAARIMFNEIKTILILS